MNENPTLPIKKVSWFYRLVKRSFDCVSALLAFLVLLPLLLVLSILVLCASRGPIIYKDKRVGKGGKAINVLKFRTMYVDAEEHPERYFNDAQMTQWKEERKVDNDPRIYPLGRFLRRSSLDELPQLANIIGGQMAVVGNRAITQEEADAHYTKEEQAILNSARPGLTGYWQVHGRNKITYESGERQKMNLHYFAIRSLWQDFKIIFETIPAIFRKDEAQ